MGDAKPYLHMKKNWQSVTDKPTITKWRSSGIVEYARVGETPQLETR